MEAVRDYPRVAVRSSHGPGKTATAAQIGLWFLKTHRNSRVITTAPTWQQVEQLLWREIRAGVTSANGMSAAVFPKPQVTKLEFDEQWFALGLSTNEPERFQGHHAPFILLIVDEASGVAEGIFEAAEGFLTAEGAHVLLVGNPTRIGGQFHRAFTTERADWRTIHISTFDTPNYTGEAVPAAIARSLPSAGWAASRARAWGEQSPMYQVRVLGNFPSEQTNTAVALHVVEAAQQRRLHADPNLHLNTIACDVARFGDDETVIATRTGMRVRLTHTYNGKATTETAGWLLSEVRRYPPGSVSVVIDDAGVGGGVTDIVREQLARDQQYAIVPVTAHNGGHAAFVPDEYPNRRSELWFAMAERLPELDLDTDDQLAADLSSPTYRMDSSGRRVVESKDDTKKRLGRSPDRGDAVLMTLVPPAADAVVASAPRRASDPGDPLAPSDLNVFDIDW